MSLVVAVVLVAHGVAHLVGFVVPWRLMTLPEMPYKTTLFAGRLDVGPDGIRVVGLLWMLAAVAFILAAIAWAVRQPWAEALTAGAALASLILCIAGWPDTRIGVVVNVLLLAATPLLGGLAWRTTSEHVRRALTPGSPAPQAFRADALAGAPEPVVRYFTHVLRDRQPLIVAADLEQDAQFFVGGGWKPLTASQRFTVDPPAFLWDARIAMAPGIPVFVRDSYVDGAGSMRGELVGVYPIVNQSGRKELDAAALHRYLAEAVWLPTALLPSARLRWSPVDRNAALATLVDRHTTVSLRFTFDEAGDVVELFAPDRLKEENGRFEPRPWTVRCTEHAEFDGVRIPVVCSVEWQMPEGPLPYWRGRITLARYTYAANAAPGTAR
jgi:hypothetical protein